MPEKLTSAEAVVQQARKVIASAMEQLNVKPTVEIVRTKDIPGISELLLTAENSENIKVLSLSLRGGTEGLQGGQWDLFIGEQKIIQGVNSHELLSKLDKHAAFFQYFLKYGHRAM